MAPPAGDVSRELQESIRRALGRPRIHLLLRARLETKPRRLEERILVLTAWRLHLFSPTTPAKAEGSLSVLEIRCISATSPTQCLPVHPVPRCAWTRSGVPWPWPLPPLLLPPAWPGSWELPWGGPCPVPPLFGPSPRPRPSTPPPHRRAPPPAAPASAGASRTHMRHCVTTTG
uniref:CARMIL pleckstrin homology domain-containing protein n=1 Tax=Gallus gallus TaxID=9031 RepID=A0A8V0XQ02_CHICK